MKIGAGVFLFVLFISSNLLAEDPGKVAVWGTRAELSFVNTSGNTDTQTLSGKIEMERKRDVNRYFLTGKILHARDNDQETSNKFSVDARYERNMTEKLFSLFSTGYLRGRFSGYEYRVFGGPGIGFSFIETKIQKLQILISTVYYHDKFSQRGKGSDNYLTGKASAKYEWKILENLKFKEILDYFISFEGAGKYFIDSEAALQVRINKSLSLGISYLVNYQNFLPSPVIQHTDTAFLTTVIADF